MTVAWALTDIIDGAPLWIYIWCIASQLLLFPLVGNYCSVKTYNITFSLLLLKDFLFCDLTTPLIAHHISSILIINKFCYRKLDTYNYTAAEFGSGFYNLITLARYYNIFVNPMFIIYTIVISLSNAYMLQYIYHYRAAFFWKIVPSLLVLGRQFFVYV